MCGDDIKILGFVQKIKKRRTSFGTKKKKALHWSSVQWMLTFGKSLVLEGKPPASRASFLHLPLNLPKMMLPSEERFSISSVIRSMFDKWQADCLMKLKYHLLDGEFISGVSPCRAVQTVLSWRYCRWCWLLHLVQNTSWLCSLLTLNPLIFKLQDLLAASGHASLQCWRVDVCLV